MRYEYASAACVNEQRSVIERRSFSWKTLIYASLYRRRALSRRCDEASFLQSDVLCRRSVAITLTVVFLSCIDALLTTSLLARGATELNPIMDYYLRHDLAVFMLVKTKLTGLCMLVLVALVNHRFLGLFQTRHLIQLVLLSYLILIGWEIVLLG